MKKLYLAVIAAMLSYAPLMARAADLSELSLEELLEVEIVSSVSKMSQKVTETPSAIRVITAQDIRRYGWRTLGEALNSLPGISIITNRESDFIGARGLVLPDDHNTRYLMVIDGTPVNDALLESAFVGDAFPLDMALINRIEYVPGAGSAVYGANAMLGTINITTRSAKGRHATELDSSIDSIGRKDLRLTTAQSLDNGAAFTLSATGMRRTGQDQTYIDAIGKKAERDGVMTPDGIAHDLDSGRNQQFYAKLEKDGFKLSLMLSDHTDHPSTAPHGANFDDPAMQVRDKVFDLTANYTTEIAQNASLYTNLTYMGSKNSVETPNGTILNVRDSDAERWFAEGRLTTTRFNQHQTAIGIDLSWETKSDLISYDIGGLNQLYYHDDHPDTRIGLYLQDQWKFVEDWQLHTGLRYDRSVAWGNHFSPRMGLTWQVTPTVSLKAIAARAFRNPNPLEARAGKDPAQALPFGFEGLSNLGLLAETVTTREFVAEWRPSDTFELSGSLYHHQLQHLIGATVTPGFNFQYQNKYGMNVTGLEAAVYYKLPSQWKLNASTTLQDADLDDGSHAPNAAKWLAKLALDGPLWRDNVFVAWELYANGPSRQIWGTPFAPVTAHNSTFVGSNLVFTANNVLPGVGIQLRINNVFDRNDTTPGSDDTPVAKLPVHGRSASLGVRYEF